MFNAEEIKDLILVKDGNEIIFIKHLGTDKIVIVEDSQHDEGMRNYIQFLISEGVRIVSFEEFRKISLSED